MRTIGHRVVARETAHLAWLVVVTIVLATLLVGVAGAARGQVSLLPRTQQLQIATGDAATDELAAVPLDDGFALIWNSAAAPPATDSETLSLQRLDLDAAKVGSPILHTVNLLTAVDAVPVPEGLVFGYLTTQPFAIPSLVVRRHQGAGLAATGDAILTDADVAPFRLTALGEDIAAASYAGTAAVFEIGSPGTADEIPLPIDDAAALVAVPAPSGDLFVFTPEPGGAAEAFTLVRYLVSGGAVVDGPDDVIDDSFVGGAPLLAAPVDGEHLIAWRRADSFPGPGHHYAALRVRADGSAQGTAFTLALAGRPDADLNALAVDGQGTTWTLWRDGADLLVAGFGPGETSAMPLEVSSGAFSDQALAVTTAGSVLVSWIDDADHIVRAQVFEECGSGGGEGGEVLCLQRGRFLAELEFETSDGEEGVGKAVPTRSVESGLFWFFTPDNWEFLVKVLAACPINGFHWVFAAPTTDIGFTLRVLDTQTLQQRTYVNPVGTLPTVINDTAAFACSP